MAEPSSETSSGSRAQESEEGQANHDNLENASEMMDPPAEDKEEDDDDDEDHQQQHQDQQHHHHQGQGQHQDQQKRQQQQQQQQHHHHQQQQQQQQRQQQLENADDEKPPITSATNDDAYTACMGEIHVQSNTYDDKDENKKERVVRNGVALIANTLRPMTKPSVLEANNAAVTPPPNRNDETTGDIVQREIALIGGIMRQLVTIENDDTRVPSAPEGTNNQGEEGEPGAVAVAADESLCRRQKGSLSSAPFVPNEGVSTILQQSSQEVLTLSDLSQQPNNLTSSSSPNVGDPAPPPPEAIAVEVTEHVNLPLAERVSPNPQKLPPSTTPKLICFHRRAFLAVVVLLTVLLAITLSVIFSSRTKPPGDSPTLTKENYIKSLLPNGTIASINEDPYSPQSKAFDFVKNDPLLEDYPKQDCPDWRIVQRFALATFYYSFSGDSWHTSEGWLDYNVPECEWDVFSYKSLLWYKPYLVDFMVEDVAYFSIVDLVDESLDAMKHDHPCGESDNHDGKYRHLWQVNNKIQGQLPLEMFLLTSLESIILGSTDFFEVKDGSSIQGPIPTQVGQLSGLKHFFILGSQLSGTIPSEIGLLNNATLLMLLGNLEGRLPTQVGQLSKLRLILLDENQLSAEVPSEVGALSVLGMLSLGWNMLSGFPTELGLLTSLRYFSTQYNQLKEIPPQLWQLTTLEGLIFGGNKIRSLPSEIGRMSALNALALWENQFTSVPSEIGLLTDLKFLSLEGNPLGEVPEEIFFLTSLRILGLDSNLLTSIPSELWRLTALEVVTLLSNTLNSTIPTEFGLLTNLTGVYLHNASLYGPIPSELGKLSLLEYLWVSHNNLTGEIPSEIFALFAMGEEQRTFSFNFTENEGLEGIIPESVCDSGLYFDCTSLLCGCSCKCVETAGKG